MSESSNLVWQVGGTFSLLGLDSAVDDGNENHFGAYPSLQPDQVDMVYHGISNL